MKKKLKLIISLIVIVSVALAIYFLFFNQKNKDIIGLWDIDGNTKYQFDSNGKGKLIVPSKEYKFSYKIKDNILSIDFENEESIDSKYEYKMVKGKLKITNIKEKNRKFTLKKLKNNALVISN